MKIIYSDSLPKIVNTILECISRIISKSNARLILFQNTVLGKLRKKYYVYFLVPILQEGHLKELRKKISSNCTTSKKHAYYVI